MTAAMKAQKERMRAKGIEGAGKEMRKRNEKRKERWFWLQVVASAIEAKRVKWKGEVEEMWG